METYRKIKHTSRTSSHPGSSRWPLFFMIAKYFKFISYFVFSSVLKSYNNIHNTLKHTEITNILLEHLVHHDDPCVFFIAKYLKKYFRYIFIIKLWNFIFSSTTKIYKKNQHTEKSNILLEHQVHSDDPCVWRL